MPDPPAYSDVKEPSPAAYVRSARCIPPHIRWRCAAGRPGAQHLSTKPHWRAANAEIFFWRSDFSIFPCLGSGSALRNGHPCATPGRGGESAPNRRSISQDGVCVDSRIPTPLQKRTPSPGPRLSAKGHDNAPVSGFCSRTQCGTFSRSCKVRSGLRCYDWIHTVPYELPRRQAILLCN
jgi:hypothetical protein